EKLPLFAYNALVDDVLLPAMGNAALGIVSIGTYSAALETPESRAFVRDYETKYASWPSAHSERGYVAAQLITAALDQAKGEVSDRMRVRDALAAAVSTIQPPRGPIRFDRYQQVITPVYITKVERRGSRAVNAVIDRIPETSQEQSWKWWNKGGGIDEYRGTTPISRRPRGEPPSPGQPSRRARSRGARRDRPRGATRGRGPGDPRCRRAAGRGRATVHHRRRVPARLVAHRLFARLRRGRDVDPELRRELRG